MPAALLVFLDVFLFQPQFLRRVQHEHLHPHVRRHVFARELAGLPKAPLRIGPFYRWLADVWRGRIRLGRMHLACAEPVILDTRSDLRTTGEEVIDRLRGAMAVTSFHLAAYLAHHREGNYTPTTLQERIECVGGEVLKSELSVTSDLDPVIAMTYREHFARFLDGDDELEQEQEQALAG